MNNSSTNRHAVLVLSNLPHTVSAIALGLALVASTVFASGQDRTLIEEDFEEERVYSPYAGRAYADNVFFGDMHFHTELSFDAAFFDIPLPDTVPPTIQDRAYTSPIWYTPGQ